MSTNSTNPPSRLKRWLRRSPWEWAWAFRRRLFPTWPHRVRFDDDMVLEIDPRDELATRYFLEQDFEVDVSAFFRDQIRPGMVVFDVGANIGHFTLLAAKRVGLSGRVHAFEASAAEYRKLSANIAVNRLSNVVANPTAVCERSGTATFHICSVGRGLYNSLGTPIQTTATSVEVPCVSLDAYLDAAQVTRVDVLKIDVEGAEPAVLRGAASLLSRPDAPIVVCEFCDATLRGMGSSSAELRKAFENLGYSVHRYDPSTKAFVPEVAGQEYEYANLICAKSAHNEK